MRQAVLICLFSVNQEKANSIMYVFYKARFPAVKTNYMPLLLVKVVV